MLSRDDYFYLENLSNFWKEWAMYCVLEDVLQMKEKSTLEFDKGTDELLWEIGGIEGLIDEAIHWALYRLNRDYGDRGIEVDTMRWEKQENALVCHFTYKGGTPIDCSDIMQDEDFKTYCSMVFGFAVSERSLRHKACHDWGMRMKMRYGYSEEQLREYVEKMDELWRSDN